MQTPISHVRHRFATMFDNSITRQITIFLLIIGVRYGSPLQCYVCTSLENPDCSSSLSTVSLTTCSPTSVDASGTTDSEATSSSSTTAITEATTESTPMENSSDTLETTAISGTTANATSDETTSTSTVTSSGVDEARISNTDESANDVNVRLVRDVAETEFSCYTLILTVDGTTVTDRGCAVTTTATCDDIMADKYPDYNKTSCITCTDDGCNSSSINIYGIVSIALPFLVLYLTR